MESGIQNPAHSSASFFFAARNTQKEKDRQRRKWEDYIYIYTQYIHNFFMILSILRMGGAQHLLTPESLHVSGPPTLGSGNCLSGRVDQGEVMVQGLKRVRWWGWYRMILSNVQKKAGQLMILCWDEILILRLFSPTIVFSIVRLFMEINMYFWTNIKYLLVFFLGGQLLHAPLLLESMLQVWALKQDIEL